MHLPVEGKYGKQDTDLYLRGQGNKIILSDEEFCVFKKIKNKWNFELWGYYTTERF